MFKRSNIYCIIFSLHPFWLEVLLQDFSILTSKNNLIFLPIVHYYKKLFLATNEFQAFASFSASPSFLRHIMFYGCFSKPINFDQSAKFLGAHCLKITQNVAFYFWILAFFTNFCPIIIDLSGYTIWPQASGFYN